MIFGASAFAQTSFASAPLGVVFEVLCLESASGIDTPSALGVFLSSVAEAITGADIIACRLLWENIDDSQTAGWTDISQPLIIDQWTEINNNQTPNWVNIVQ